MNHIDIIEKAGSLIHPKQLKDGLIGDVGCILICKKSERC